MNGVNNDFYLVVCLTNKKLESLFTTRVSSEKSHYLKAKNQLVEIGPLSRIGENHDFFLAESIFKKIFWTYLVRNLSFVIAKFKACLLFIQLTLIVNMYSRTSRCIVAGDHRLFAFFLKRLQIESFKKCLKCQFCFAKRLSVPSYTEQLWSNCQYSSRILRQLTWQTLFKMPWICFNDFEVTT